MKKMRYKMLILVVGVGLAAAALGLALLFAPPQTQVEPFRVTVERIPEEISAPVTKEEQTPSPVVEAPKVSSKPEIAILIDDVGLDLKGSKRATELPAFVTLSFMPYAFRLREQTKEARDKGHELMLHMPMEPVGRADPGPGALLVGLPEDELRQRFQTGLASFIGFDGVNNHMGSRFTADTTGMEIVVDELKQRHLFFLDSRTSAKSVGEALARQHGVPTISRDIFIDDDEAPEAIRDQLEQAERTARHKGHAVAIGHPHVVTLEALEHWLPEAQARGIVFVPVRELVKP